MVTTIPNGNWFLRFYQPGLAIACALFMILATELEIKHRPLKARISIPLYILSGWILGDYPWVALAILSFLFLRIIFNWGKINRMLPSITGIVSLSISVSLFTLASNNTSADYLHRLGSVFSRLPDQQTLINNALLLIFILPFWKYSVGRVGVTLQISNLVAINSSFITGFTVQPYHYQYVSMLSLTLLVGCILNWVFGKCESKPCAREASWRLWAGSSLQLLYWPLVLFLLVFGSINFVPYNQYEYYYVPREDKQLIESLQAICRPEDGFFSPNVGYWWSIPARTTCTNLVPNGLDSQLSNEAIAAQFSAILEQYEVVNSKTELLTLVAPYIENIGSGQRETVRSLYRYSNEDREVLHSLWYLFHSGLNHEEYKPYVSILFEKVSFSTLDLVWLQLASLKKPIGVVP